ncbi:LPXTG cell wall anchor domain-containing protein [Acidaminobacter sp. JC074]|uniref:fasciclin domain-containing protein n=1 Tax=Acidaminobacter sp. JC074 TaxID=2530199 RepID=UPI001F0D0217|nr:fasciclin domain-containing protein [Acidaminobacter sp. JC074]MCH4886718.1 LPXTG cell wall anchor domain-containing protein [Acidaminobacter sp. JC074]
MKQITSIIMIVILLFGMTGVYAAEGDIVDIASNIEDFSILVTALQEADLVGALQGEGPFTVFAPNDQAFSNLLSDLNITAEELLGHPQLSEVLLYHVVSGKVMSTDLSDGMMAGTLQGESLQVDLSSGVMIDMSNVTSADVEATNGVIHVIDKVLVPDSFILDVDQDDIVDIASSIDYFSVLVAALQEADLVGALQGEGPFTVFAPTDEAFVQLLGELNITAEDLLGHPQLSEVLLYHVVSGKVMSSDLSDGMMAETLQGESVQVDLSSGVMIDMSNVKTPNIEASNGVIHIVDKVLVPDSFVLGEKGTMVEKDIVDIALGNDDFSMLVSLLQEADLVEVLQGEGPYTVFAPTNEAFMDLLDTLNITPAELMAQPDLSKVLLYHVVSGKVMSTDLTDGLMAPTVNGNDIKFDLSNGVMVNQGNVISADIEATNGVVHVVDSVLIPSDFMLLSVNMGESLPKTSDIGLTPYVLMAIVSIGGIGFINRKKK